VRERYQHGPFISQTGPIPARHPKVMAVCDEARCRREVINYTSKADEFFPFFSLNNVGIYFLRSWQEKNEETISHCGHPATNVLFPPASGCANRVNSYFCNFFEMFIFITVSRKKTWPTTVKSMCTSQF
jgi:hypothetical protein